MMFTSLRGLLHTVSAILLLYQIPEILSMRILHKNLNAQTLFMGDLYYAPLQITGAYSAPKWTAPPPAGTGGGVLTAQRSVEEMISSTTVPPLYLNFRIRLRL